jgi:hypothetical protein
LSGKDKNKGSYVVTKSDGSKVKRFFQWLKLFSKSL